MQVILATGSLLNFFSRNGSFFGFFWILSKLFGYPVSNFSRQRAHGVDFSHLDFFCRATSNVSSSFIFPTNARTEVFRWLLFEVRWGPWSMLSGMSPGNVVQHDWRVVQQSCGLWCDPSFPSNLGVLDLGPVGKRQSSFHPLCEWWSATKCLQRLDFHDGRFFFRDGVFFLSLQFNSSFFVHGTILQFVFRDVHPSRYEGYLIFFCIWNNHPPSLAKISRHFSVCECISPWPFPFLCLPSIVRPKQQGMPQPQAPNSLYVFAQFFQFSTTSFWKCTSGVFHKTFFFRPRAGFIFFLWKYFTFFHYWKCMGDGMCFDQIYWPHVWQEFDTIHCDW